MVEAPEQDHFSSGISFGGVIAFIFADLIVIPIQYYGMKMGGFILGTFYLSMALAALVIEFLLQTVGPVPAERHAEVVENCLHVELHDYSKRYLSDNRRMVSGLLLQNSGLEMMRTM
jgi:hypothetical protein